MPEAKKAEAKKSPPESSLLDKFNAFDPLGEVCEAMTDLITGKVFDTKQATDSVKGEGDTDDDSADKTTSGRASGRAQPSTVVNNFYGGKRTKAKRVETKRAATTAEGEEGGAEGEGDAAS